MDNKQRYLMAIQLLKETINLIKEDYLVQDLEEYIKSLELKAHPEKMESLLKSED